MTPLSAFPWWDQALRWWTACRHSKWTIRQLKSIIQSVALTEVGCLISNPPTVPVHTSKFHLYCRSAPAQLLKASTNSSLIPFNNTGSSLVSFVLSSTLSMLSLSSLGRQCLTS